MLIAVYYNLLDVKGAKTELAAYTNRYYEHIDAERENETGVVARNSRADLRDWSQNVRSRERFCSSGCSYLEEAYEVYSTWANDSRSTSLFTSGYLPMIPFVKMLAAKWPQLEFTLSFVNQNGSDSGQLRVQGNTVLDDRYTTVYNNINSGFEFNGDWNQYLGMEADMAKLPQRNRHIPELIKRIRVEGPAFLHDNQDTVTETGDYQLAAAYIEHADTSLDNIWNLMLNATTRVGGSVIMRAAGEATNIRKSEIGRLFETLAPILVPNTGIGVTGGIGDYHAVNNAGRPDGAGIAAAHKYLLLAAARNKTDEWLENLAALLPEWHNKQAADLITAAYFLLDTDDSLQSNASVKQQKLHHINETNGRDDTQEMA